MTREDPSSLAVGCAGKSRGQRGHKTNLSPPRPSPPRPSRCNSSPATGPAATRPWAGTTTAPWWWYTWPRSPTRRPPTARPPRVRQLLQGGRGLVQRDHGVLGHRYTQHELRQERPSPVESCHNPRLGIHGCTNYCPTDPLDDFQKKKKKRKKERKKEKRSVRRHRPRRLSRPRRGHRAPRRRGAGNEQPYVSCFQVRVTGEEREIVRKRRLRVGRLRPVCEGGWGQSQDTICHRRCECAKSRKKSSVGAKKPRALVQAEG